MTSHDVKLWIKLEKVSPSNSSPAVSLEGATLTHLLVNLDDENEVLFNILCTESTDSSWFSHGLVPDGFACGFVLHDGRGRVSFVLKQEGQRSFDGICDEITRMRTINKSNEIYLTNTTSSLQN